MAREKTSERVTRPSIFITGAGSGIGRATAELFGRAGWFVGLYDLAETAVETMRQQLGAERAVAGRLDVRDGAAVAAALRQFFRAAGGRLDVMFNCAGVFGAGHFEDIEPARHQLIVDVNLRGVINGCHAALPYLRRTRGARLINMASASALYGTPGLASYSATKFAVRGLTEALDLEWSRHGIRVMDVSPTYVDTPMVRSMARAPKSMTRLGLLPADHVARAVWRAARWRWWTRVHWYPGARTKLIAIAQKISPAWINRLGTRLIAGY
jgi:NAD(P)-dependent dehydrogenase (short-subunit alcohol dehydrogenase family)